MIQIQVKERPDIKKFLVKARGLFRVVISPTCTKVADKLSSLKKKTRIKLTLILEGSSLTMKAAE
jgi:hypothetical protein